MTATSADALRARSNITSVMLINRVVVEVCAALPQSLRIFAQSCTLCDQWAEEGKYSLPHCWEFRHVSVLSDVCVEQLSEFGTFYLLLFVFHLFIPSVMRK